MRRLRQAERSAGRPSSVRPSCAISSARSSADPRRLALPPGCGPHAGCAISSSTGPGFATTRTTSGAFCASSTGPASVRAGGRSSAMRRRSGNGRRSRGHGFKRARRERRTIGFIDESGLSERPHRARIWAPRGRTPVLQHHFRTLTTAALPRVNPTNIAP